MSANEAKIDEAVLALLLLGLHHIVNELAQILDEEKIPYRRGRGV